MDLNSLILFFVLIIFGIISYKYFIPFLKKIYIKLLVDDQFSKPQAFHDSPVSTAGGLVIFLSFLILIIYSLIFKNIFFEEYLMFCTLFFLLGFIDDIKVNIKPKTRLFSMIVLLIILVGYTDFHIDKTGIEFLNDWIQSSKTFSLVFVCLCFLFIINGANLIDGYNGLLGFHSLIIFLNLFLVNYLSGNTDLANFLIFIIVILSIFIFFNFPRAKIFLGDGGSYLLGSLIAISTIQTSLANPTVSPFYFCILLFYLFFEVFFSFFRKLSKKKSPFYPDAKHLHMLLYKKLIKKNSDKLKSNYFVSVIVNTIYLILIIPAMFMMKDGIFCKYYSIVFFIIYIFSYKITNDKSKIY